MSDTYSIKKSTLEAIANAIRAKTGKTDLLYPDSTMITAIESIYIGGADTGDATITAREVAKGEIAYGVDGKVIGTSPFTFIKEGSDVDPPTVESWENVVYGNGVFVAIASDTNVVAYSTSGEYWAKATMPTTAHWKALTYGGGKFVAIAADSNIAAHSADGINWVKCVMPYTAKWVNVAYGNGKFVAVENYVSSEVAYSTDGINWNTATVPSSVSLTDVGYGNGKFIVTTTASPYVFRSEDGITWVRGSLPSSKTWRSISYVNDKFIAVVCNVKSYADTYSTTANVYTYSTDGITWTSTTFPLAGYWTRVVYGNGKYVTINSRSAVAAYSEDGLNWTTVDLPVSADWRMVAFGNGRFVAVSDASEDGASDTTYIVYSDDGVTWYQSDYTVADPNASSVEYKVSHENNLLLTCDTGIMIAADGCAPRVLIIQDGVTSLQDP